jgi:mercuric ion binding protein
MKILKIFAAIAILCIAFNTAHAQTITETIKVSGNCGTCEKHIEKAAKDAGADKANWNKKTKFLTVTYDRKKTTNDAIQKKIAAVGYDTEKYTGDIKAYKDLDECCQYEGKRKN